MDAQVLYVKQRLQNYLERIAALSQAATPPGTNAANGWFREYMVNDGVIVQCGQAPTLPLSGEAQQLYGIYSFFYGNVERAFRDNGNHSASAIHGQVLWPGIAGMLGEVAAVIGSIVQLMTGGDQAKEQAKENLANSIKALVEKVNGSGYVWGGAHANGWISVYARDAGNWTIAQLDSVGFPAGKASDAGKVADVLRQICLQIAALPTEHHSPWLRPEWQIKFQAICEAGAMTLRSYA